MQVGIVGAMARRLADRNRGKQRKHHARPVPSPGVEAQVGHELNALRGTARLGIAFVDVEVDALIEEMDLDVLDVIAVEMKLDVGKLGRRAIEHRADEARIEMLEPPHLHQCMAPECSEQGGMLVAAEETQMASHFELDLIVVG
jgi:hypothetical protein